MFDKVKNIMDLAKSIDFGKLEEISKKVDLGAVMDAVSKMDDKQLHGLMKMLSAGKEKKELPPINGDFYAMDSK